MEAFGSVTLVPGFTVCCTEYKQQIRERISDLRADPSIVGVAAAVLRAEDGVENVLLDLTEVFNFPRPLRPPPPPLIPGEEDRSRESEINCIVSTESD